MVEQHQPCIDYWEDKKAKLRNIAVPMYVTASYSAGLHTEGSPENLDDLQRFFDKYMLGIGNGWEETPKVRCSMLGYNRPSVVNRPTSRYPPADFDYEILFPDANTGELSDRQPPDQGVVEYQAASRSDDGRKFVHTVKEYTELFGISKLKVWMSTEDHDDMDVYVVIRKLDKDGKALWHQNIPMKDLPPETTVADIPNENVWRYIGPNGRLRASHRQVAAENLDDLSEEDYRSLMGPAYVHHPHTSTQPLAKGEIVELEISLWPGGRVFDAGEGLSLEIKGHNPIVPEFAGLDEKLENYNVGRHRVHTGGDCPSQVTISVRRGLVEE